MCLALGTASPGEGLKLLLCTTDTPSLHPRVPACPVNLAGPLVPHPQETSATFWPPNTQEEEEEVFPGSVAHSVPLPSSNPAQSLLACTHTQNSITAA